MLEYTSIHAFTWEVGFLAIISKWIHQYPCLDLGSRFLSHYIIIQPSFFTVSSIQFLWGHFQNFRNFEKWATISILHVHFHNIDIKYQAYLITIHFNSNSNHNFISCHKETLTIYFLKWGQLSYTCFSLSRYDRSNLISWYAYHSQDRRPSVGNSLLKTP